MGQPVEKNENGQSGGGENKSIPVPVHNFVEGLRQRYPLSTSVEGLYSRIDKQLIQWIVLREKSIENHAFYNVLPSKSWRVPVDFPINSGKDLAASCTTPPRVAGSGGLTPVTRGNPSSLHPVLISGKLEEIRFEIQLNDMFHAA